MRTASSLLEAFCNAFANASGAQLEEITQSEQPAPDSGATDATLSFTMPDQSRLQLGAELMRSVFPRDVRMVVDRYRRARWREDENAAIPLIVIADALSPGARAVLREEGIYYYDLSGTLYFKSDPWVLDIERASKPKPRKVERIFSAAREQVVHALLDHWHHAEESEQWIYGAALAAKAGVSAYTVSQLMKELERQDWIETRGSGPHQQRRLRDPAGLLDARAERWRQRKDPTVRCYVFDPSRASILDAVAPKLISQSGWMITGATAANNSVPTLTSVERLELIVHPGRTQQFLDTLGIKSVEKGSNFSIVERDGAALQFPRSAASHSDVIFASPFIQYLDLLNGYGRNKELAEAYRRKVLHIESTS